MKSVWLLFILLGSFCLDAQEFTAEEVREDLTFLKQQIETFQPTLGDYTPGFGKKADSLLHSLDDGANSFEYYQLVSRLIHFAGESHYEVGQWEDTIHSGFLDNRYAYLPIGVYVTSPERLFVRYDLSVGPRLSKGDEILSINGHSATRIIRHLSALIPNDGRIETYPLRQLEKGFNWMYYLGYEQPEEFRLEIRRENLRMTIDVAAITRQEMVENAQKQRSEKPAIEEKEEDPMARFAELSIEDSLAILKLKGFSRSLVEELGIKAPKFYKEVFQELADNQVEILVIDLRENNGGRLEFESGLLPYIMKKMPEGPYRRSVSWDGKVKNYKTPKPSKLLFDGQIYVFTDGSSFSAGSSLARHLKEYADATIIGEETGSRYEGFAAGSKQYVILPNSYMRIGIPRYAIEYPDNKKQDADNRGVLPDIIVERDIEQILQGTNMWKEALFQILQE